MFAFCSGSGKFQVFSVNQSVPTVGHMPYWDNLNIFIITAAIWQFNILAGPLENIDIISHLIDVIVIKFTFF